MFTFYENLAVAGAWLTHLIGASSSEALGVLPALILTVSQVVQAHVADHPRFLQCFLEHTLLSSWPLLLVMVGTRLSRDTFTDNRVPQKDGALVDLTPSRSTLR
jgi:hypothetical protein